MPEPQSDVVSRVDAMYQDYAGRAKELAGQGARFIGYVCSFVPLEMIAASGCFPFRIRGDVHEPITKGDTLLETIVCPFYRSCFDLMLKGKYDFASGVVIPHACDSMVRSYDVWNYALNLPYTHFVNVPSVCGDSALRFFEAELISFKQSLEKYTGVSITDEKLAHSIRAYNLNRKKARDIYALRKTHPPAILGSDLVKVLSVGASLPVEESNELFDQVLQACSGANKTDAQSGPRILIDGPCLDNMDLIKLIEDCGAQVVGDTTCNGARDHFPLTDEIRPPVQALADRYLNKLNCPKTYRDNQAGTFEKDADNRFGDIESYAKDYSADGVILYVYKYCDPFGFEVPARKTYLESKNIPVLYLEDLYSSGATGQLKTRIQAFLEMIG